METTETATKPVKIVDSGVMLAEGKIVSSTVFSACSGKNQRLGCSFQVIGFLEDKNIDNSTRNALIRLMINQLR